VLAAQAPLDLYDQMGWEAQVLQGTVQGLGSSLCLAPIAL
jgi:hypothetical protein